MLLYATAIFVGAFLLFQVQPMIGKILLPWFGGGAGVWTVCLLFFQVALLIGYAYADLLQRLTRCKTQIITHLVLLTCSVAWLPIGASRTRLEAAQDLDPTFGLLVILTLSIGLPYAVLSSTSPLMQKWFSLSHPGRSPYRLYALSNLGSVLALVSFPFLIEPRLTTQTQTMIWSGLYGVYLASVAVCAVALWKKKNAAWPQPQSPQSPPPEDAALHPRPTASTVVFWLALSAVGSLTLMSSTNFLTQDVAPLPLLWICPLTLYLVSFIIAFEYEKLYLRWVFVPLLIIAVFFSNLLFHQAGRPALWVSVTVCLSALFSICMVCHGELARSKPDPRHLTFFFLIVALGGAVGGVVVTFLAPVLFQDYWEYHAGLLAAWLLALVAIARSQAAQPARPGSRLGRKSVVMLGALPLIALAASFAVAAWSDRAGATVIARNFYGSFRVEPFTVAGSPFKRIRHGTTDHGIQFENADSRWRPAGYYGPYSGLGLAIRLFPFEDPAIDDAATLGQRPPLHLGVVGLGTGTTAAYLKPGDRLEFYEINPQIEELARTHFSYLKDAEQRTGEPVPVHLGDARVVLDQQLRSEQSKQFDILAIDAFSSDAIPTHLLTAEASDLYWNHLKANGVLAIHISNRHLDLLPVVRAIAERAGKSVHTVHDPGQALVHGAYRSVWVLVTENERMLRVLRRFSPLPSDLQKRASFSKPLQLWTDDFASIWSILGANEIPSPWLSAPLQGYFILDRAAVLSPSTNFTLSDEARLLYLNTGGRANVMLLTIESIASASIDPAPDLTLERFTQAFMDNLLPKGRENLGYMLVYERQTNELVLKAFDLDRKASRLSAERLQEAARLPLERAQAQLAAGQPANVVLVQVTQALTRSLQPRSGEGE